MKCIAGASFMFVSLYRGIFVRKIFLNLQRNIAGMMY